MPNNWNILLDSLRKQKPSAAAISKLDSVAAMIELWEDAVLEVPGFAHEHDHTHDHQHKSAQKMTDESMLDYQRNAKEAIESIRAKL